MPFLPRIFSCDRKIIFDPIVNVPAWTFADYPPACSIFKPDGPVARRMKVPRLPAVFTGKKIIAGAIRLNLSRNVIVSRWGLVEIPAPARFRAWAKTKPLNSQGNRCVADSSTARRVNTGNGRIGTRPVISTLCTLNSRDVPGIDTVPPDIPTACFKQV